MRSPLGMPVLPRRHTSQPAEPEAGGNWYRSRGQVPGSSDLGVMMVIDEERIFPELGPDLPPFLCKLNSFPLPPHPSHP